MTGKKNKLRTVTKYPNAKPGSLEDNTKTVVEKSQPYLRPIAPKPTYVNAPPLDLTTQSVLPDKNEQLQAQDTAIKPVKKHKNKDSVDTSSSEEEMDVDEENPLTLNPQLKHNLKNSLFLTTLLPQLLVYPIPQPRPLCKM